MEIKSNKKYNRRKFLINALIVGGGTVILFLFERCAILKICNIKIKKMRGSILNVPGVKVGHKEDRLNQTGCSVVLFESGAVCGVDVRGSAPGTRETDLLNPVNAVERIHAIVLTGGSAYGLEASTGVMKWLERKGVGYQVGINIVPIVPSAVLFDLNFGDPAVRPDAQMGFDAAEAASRKSFKSGNTGAGAGATIGKMLGMDKAMKGGLGTASIQGPNGLVVSAMVAVNAVGEIRDPSTGQRIAGARNKEGNILDIQALFLEQAEHESTQPGTNTTIGIICCNAGLNKTQMNKIAQMAHDGLARTIYPVHTMYDGDTIFAATTGNVAATVNIVGMLAAEVMAQAVLDGVRSAHTALNIPGYAG